MVRVSLKSLVNLRTNDIMWWGNGRYYLKPANKQLRLDKDELDKKVFECEYACNRMSDCPFVNRVN